MTVLRFGTFELDGEAGELRRQGRLVRLSGQPFKALELLASRPGEVVTREQLQRHIWGDSRFVEFDRGLNFCIAAVRDALGDSARSPRFVETLPRRGYRFIADVHPLAPPAAAGVSSGAATGRRPRWWWAAVLPIVLAQQPTILVGHTRDTTTPAALRAFERGMGTLEEGRAARRRSLAEFRDAVRLDPRFAEAHYALADVYLDLAGSGELPAAAALARARASGLRAIALEEMPATRLLLGSVRLMYDHDWAGARRDLVAAAAGAPGWDAAWAANAKFLSASGDHAAAIEAIDRAESISPSCDLILWDSALIRYRAGRNAAALEKLRAAETFGPPRDRDPAAWRTAVRWLALRIHAADGHWLDAARAAEELDRDADLRPAAFTTPPEPREWLRRFLARAADRLGRAPDGARAPAWIATLYAAAGDGDAALDWLERAAASWDPDLPYSLRNPEFLRLIGHERFRRIADEVHLPDE